jgi:hypothetical protein
MPVVQFPIYLKAPQLMVDCFRRLLQQQVDRAEVVLAIGLIPTVAQLLTDAEALVEAGN